MGFKINQEALAKEKASRIAMMMMAEGLERERAQRIADVSSHAVSEALLTLDRTCAVMPDRDEYMATLAVAATWLREQSHALYSQLARLVDEQEREEQASQRR